jgi:predicted GNAT superfamily acetyltransferase
VSLLRPITPEDHAEVLALNERHVELLAPMDAPRLQTLRERADTAGVIEVGGVFAGFVLTFAAGSAHDSENFAWFSEHYDDFCYLDRVVVHERFRRRGLAGQVYDELETACGRAVFALEVNLDPPNEPSLAFHRARGFTEVGRRTSGGHLVTLQVKQLARP